MTGIVDVGHIRTQNACFGGAPPEGDSEDPEPLKPLIYRCSQSSGLVRSTDHELTLFADLEHFGTQNDCFGAAPWRVGSEGSRPPKPHKYIDVANCLA